MIFQLYTSIPNTQLKSRLKNNIHRYYSKKDNTPRYVLLSGDSSYFVKKTIPNHLQNIPKKMFSKCWNLFSSKTYLPSVVNTCFNKRSAFQFVIDL